MKVQRVFKPSQFSYGSSHYGLIPYGDDTTVPAETVPEVQEAEPAEGESSFGQYGEFVRKLLGWDRTAHEELDVLKGILYSLENGPVVDRQLAAARLGHPLAIESAIFDVKNRISTAEKAARTETLKNLGTTTALIGAGVLAFATVGLVAAKSYSAYQQAKLTTAQIKKLQEGV